MAEKAIWSIWWDMKAGSYLTYMAVSSPEEAVPGDNVQMEMALSYFEGLSADTYTGEVTLHDGTKENHHSSCCQK